MNRIIFILIIVAVIGGFYFQKNIEDFFAKINSQIDQKISIINHLEKTITTPKPLIGPTEEKPSFLTVVGIVAETNKHRMQNNLPPLTINLKLNSVAEIKINDMFVQQYFEHESPDGIGPGDLANQVGYEFLSVGENLALGNYADDREVVVAWMNSPGHRENILNPKYTEIGVSVRKDLYNRQNIWMAVQEFGRPLSDCAQPNENLAERIEDNKAQLVAMEKELNERKREIDRSRPRNDPNYNQKVLQYNELVADYNLIATQTENLIDTYNFQVEIFNSCI